MKQLLDFLKTTLLGGVLVIAPLWAGLLILLKGLSGAELVVRPISDSLTPFTGSIFIMPAERVHLSNVSLAKALHCISRYGTGSHELLAALTPVRSHMTPATTVETTSSASQCS
jgi:uncharacterized membrane protein